MIHPEPRAEQGRSLPLSLLHTAQHKEKAKEDIYKPSYNTLPPAGDQRARETLRDRGAYVRQSPAEQDGWSTSSHLPAKRVCALLPCRSPWALCPHYSTEQGRGQGAKQCQGLVGGWGWGWGRGQLPRSRRRPVRPGEGRSQDKMQPLGCTPQARQWLPGPRKAGLEQTTTHSCHTHNIPLPPQPVTWRLPGRGESPVPDVQGAGLIWGGRVCMAPAGTRSS